MLQFDALIDRLTGREMLTMYARLRGISDDKIDEVVSVTIEQLSLGKWADKLCGNYRSVTSVNHAVSIKSSCVGKHVLTRFLVSISYKGFIDA